MKFLRLLANKLDKCLPAQLSKMHTKYRARNLLFSYVLTVLKETQARSRQQRPYTAGVFTLRKNSQKREMGTHLHMERRIPCTDQAAEQQ